MKWYECCYMEDTGGMNTCPPEYPSSSKRLCNIVVRSHPRVTNPPINQQNIIVRQCHKPQRTALWTGYSRSSHSYTVVYWKHCGICSTNSTYHHTIIHVGVNPMLPGGLYRHGGIMASPSPVALGKILIYLNWLYHHNDRESGALYWFEDSLISAPTDTRPRNPTYYTVITKPSHQWSTMYQVTRICRRSSSSPQPTLSAQQVTLSWRSFPLLRRPIANARSIDPRGTGIEEIFSRNDRGFPILYNRPSTRDVQGEPSITWSWLITSWTVNKTTSDPNGHESRTWTRIW